MKLSLTLILLRKKECGQHKLVYLGFFEFGSNCSHNCLKSLVLGGGSRSHYNNKIYRVLGSGRGGKT